MKVESNTAYQYSCNFSLKYTLVALIVMHRVRSVSDVYYLPSNFQLCTHAKRVCYIRGVIIIYKRIIAEGKNSKRSTKRAKFENLLLFENVKVVKPGTHKKIRALTCSSEEGLKFSKEIYT